MLVKLFTISATLLAYCIWAHPLQGNEKVVDRGNLFTKDRLIYSTSFDISNIFVPVKGHTCDDKSANKNITTPSDDGLFIFFSVVEKKDGETKSKGEYVLTGTENRTLHKILKNGLSAAADHSENLDVYIGAEDGIYKYTLCNVEAVKYGSITDKIIQIKVTYGTGHIYILTSPDYRIYNVTNDGTTKTRIESIPCAKNFAIDFENNIYYHCDDYKPFVLAKGSDKPVAFEGFENVNYGMLLSPLLGDSELLVRYFADGVAYELLANGSRKETEYRLVKKPTALSLDTGVILYYAIDGKIYEFNYLKDVLQALMGAILGTITKD